jgi:hypothetical protein
MLNILIHKMRELQCNSYASLITTLWETQMSTQCSGDTTMLGLVTRESVRACVDGERLRFEPSIDRTGFKVEDKPIAHEWFEERTKLSALGA